MAEFMVVPARYLLGIGRLDPVAAAPLADAAMTAHHAVRNSREVLRPGATVIVIGVGGLGHVAVQLLAAMNGVRIVAVDISEAKLQAAVRYGASICLHAESATAANLLELTDGRGADAIFDFVGTQSTVDLAAQTVSPGGIYQLVGVGGGTISMPPAPRFGDSWPYGATLQSSYGGTRGDLQQCIALAVNGQLQIETERFALEEALKAFERLEQGDISGRAVLCP
jgi:propanol-preferring alcohol dehydrogenase